MILYHRTTKENAEAILKTGFTDSEGFYGMPMRTRGVFLSNRPVDSNEGAADGALLQVDLPLTEDELDRFEWKEDGKPYREWQIPARLLNSDGRVRLSGYDEGPN